MPATLRFTGCLRSAIAALIAVVMIAGSNAALAQVETPPLGSPVRAAILEAVRGITAAELGGPIELEVVQMRVVGEWAFVTVSPQRPGGGEIFYTFTRYQGPWAAGALDTLADVLLRLTPAGWLVFEYSFGAADVQWGDWIGRYPTPREVFPTLGPGGP
jgi:hypothetical protein